MAKKRKAPGLKVKATAEEKEQKPKVEIKHEESEPEEDEQEVEESDSEEEESESEEEEEEEEEDEEEEEEVEEEEESESEEEEDEGSKKETLRKLLEPFSKEQIIDFLKEAALKDKSILSNITKTADSDPTHRKIFVHGLGWDATSDQVSSVFKHYGEIEECKVVTDKITGRAKGYGFVLFKSRTSARKALKEPQKKIGNRMTSSQLASAGPSPNGSSGSKNSNAVLPNPNPGSSANLGFQQQQQGDFGNFNYMSPGFYAPMVGQTPGIGLVNPMMVSALSQNGIGATVTPQSLRISGSYGNINSVSPSVIGNYASQMALQGLGAYQSQNPQLGHSSVTSTGGGGGAGAGAGAGAAPTRQQQPGFGSFGTNFPSYFGGR